ncbi:MAG: D-aminoacyl-tRNA deacylase [Kiritimatiellae bacterium]|jgi:D-tyrosyl-tRNA(Tyr) deacylase|nr:D-aminoacyl-tRNA deacylase [Kiritimatiellia bacterium]
MKALIQRVSEASVEVDGKVVAQIEQGLLILLGVTLSDGSAEVDRLVRKIPALRIFEDAGGNMNCSVEDIGGSVIIVSQFTLYASTKKGNRPGFSNAAPPEQAEPLYEELVAKLRSVMGVNRVGTGIFGAHMKVRLLNDGPVTIELLSKAVAFKDSSKLVG